MEKENNLLVGEQDIISIVAEAFEIDPHSLNMQSRRDEIDEWDSMGMLMLMAEFDERFNIVLDEEKLANLQSIEDILNALNNENCN